MLYTRKAESCVNDVLFIDSAKYNDDVIDVNYMYASSELKSNCSSVGSLILWPRGKRGETNSGRMAVS